MGKMDFSLVDVLPDQLECLNLRNNVERPVETLTQDRPNTPRPNNGLPLSAFGCAYHASNNCAKWKFTGKGDFSLVDILSA